MSLRIRRGTDAQRQTLTFDQGEIVFTTDTKKVYVGDGITAGGNNILATSAGVGVSFNATTQAFDFNTASLGLTTSVVTEGTNKYFTSQRAQDAAASLFTAAGSPTSTGTITGTIASGTITVSVAPNPALAAGERFVVAGVGGNGLLATTYYVVSVTSNSIVLASSQALAIAGTAITSLTTGSITGTTYTAGGTDTGITFSYDSVNHVMTVNSSGVTSVVSDTSPSLGGNLNLNSHNINGTGNISVTGTLSATTGLGANLPLNNFNINGTGNINITGTLTSIQTANGSPLATLYGEVYPVDSWISLNMSRGTPSAPTAVVAGDTMSGIIVYGYDGTAYSQSVAFGAQVDPLGTVTAGAPAGQFVVVATKSGGGRNSMTFSSAGVLSAPVHQVGLFAGSGAYPSAPAKGMIIFDSNVNHFYGYNGTAWVAFTGP